MDSNKNCFNKKCKPDVQNINTLIFAPFEKNDTELKNLFSFFLHLAPNIESCHSKKISKDRQNILFGEMMDNRHFEYHLFCEPSCSIEKELGKAYIDKNCFCLRCKRYVCKYKWHSKDDKESNLECFLRHIRNSIAHGRVYEYKKSNNHYILFEDINDKKDKVSARIICVKSDLIHWKKILSK